MVLFAIDSKKASKPDIADIDVIVINILLMTASSYCICTIPEKPMNASAIIPVIIRVIPGPSSPLGIGAFLIFCLIQTRSNPYITNKCSAKSKRPAAASTSIRRIIAKDAIFCLPGLYVKPTATHVIPNIKSIDISNFRYWIMPMSK